MTKNVIVTITSFNDIEGSGGTQNWAHTSLLSFSFCEGGSTVVYVV